MPSWTRSRIQLNQQRLVHLQGDVDLCLYLMISRPLPLQALGRSGHFSDTSPYLVILRQADHVLLAQLLWIDRNPVRQCARQQLPDLTMIFTTCHPSNPQVHVGLQFQENLARNKRKSSHGQDRYCRGNLAVAVRRKREAAVLRHLLCVPIRQ